jgi:beta-lactamase superfamily II metal-dependent hydrolase
MHQGDTSDCCWVQDSITILAPTAKLDTLADDTEEYNHQSYVLLVEHQGVRILLGGDASKEAWEEIKNTWGAHGLKADIFVAPHHGSEKNVLEEVFAHIQPKWVLVSVAEGTDYAYDYYKRLASVGVASTKQYGNIWVEIPGADAPFTVRAERA